jgi:nucleoside-diphosphate-sugar epimerase
MKRCLVIGSGSMLGVELCTQLAAAQNEVLRCGRSAPADVIYDLASLAPPPASPLGTIDAVFVCAAHFQSNSFDQCIESALVNNVSNIRVAEWCDRLDSKHVIMAGSVWSDPVAVPSIYGLTKAQGEQMMQLLCQQADRPLSVLRLPQLCDDHGRCARHQPWYSRIVACAAAGQDLRLAPGDAPRSFLHVSDAARAMINAWTKGVHGTHALLSRETLNYGGIADLAFKVFQRGGRVVAAPEMKPFRPMSFPPASSQADILLETTPISIEQALKRIRDMGTGDLFPA